MTNPVQALIDRPSPAPICDNCVAERLALDSVEAANINVSEVVGTGGFERRRDVWSLCSEERIVTRKI